MAVTLVLSIFKEFNWTKYFKENWIIVIISIIIGAASHLFWDSFTHYNGYFVGAIPELKNSINLLGKQIFIFKILQHASSLIGAIIITYSLLKLPKSKLSKTNIEIEYWIILTMLASTIITIKFLSSENTKQIGNFIVSSICAVIIALIITSLFWKKSNAS